MSLRWDNAAKGYVDRYGRDAARCRAEQEAAAYFADRARRIVAAIEAGAITLGREAGPKFVGRFLLNADVLDAIAERDAEHAADVERANAEERQRTEEWQRRWEHGEQ